MAIIRQGNTIYPNAREAVGTPSGPTPASANQARYPNSRSPDAAVQIYYPDAVDPAARQPTPPAPVIMVSDTDDNDADGPSPDESLTVDRP